MKKRMQPLFVNAEPTEKIDGKRSKGTVFFRIVKIAAIVLFCITVVFGAAAIGCIGYNDHDELGGWFLITAGCSTVGAGLCALAAIALSRSSGAKKASGVFFVTLPFMLFVIFAAFIVLLICGGVCLFLLALPSGL